MRKVLILGGTAEAAELAARLAGDDRLATVTSLAGLTRLPGAVSGAVRKGGFGGAEGLAHFLQGEGYDALIDATHPFAARIARHAFDACMTANVPRVKLVRRPFPRPEDLVVSEVADMAEAASGIPIGASVFLAAGRRELEPWRQRTDLKVVIRMIEPPAPGEVLPDWKVILDRPASDPQAEQDLMVDHRITHLIAKDSGGKAYAKIEAARRLQIPVVLLRRPQLPGGDITDSVDGVLAWIEQTVFAVD